MDQKRQISKNSENRICAVVVTYHPNPDLLERVVAALEGQVAAIVIVDNTEKKHDCIVKSLPHVNKIIFGENKGVAAAHNAGIRWAQNKGFDHVLLMDQDSVPDQHMVLHLFRSMQKLEEKGASVAAVGPLCYNSRSNSYEPFLIRRNHWFRRVKCKKSSACFSVVYLISSGCLIALKALNIVGEMEEELFIDHIDVEWGSRALSKGLNCFAVCQATITHQLGEVITKKIIPLKRKVIKHSPERYYYQYRNAILLFKQPHVPLAWVIYHIFRQLVPRFFMQALLIPPRRMNLMMMITGLYHGFCNITGPYVTQESR